MDPVKVAFMITSITIAYYAVVFSFFGLPNF